MYFLKALFHWRYCQFAILSRRSASSWKYVSGKEGNGRSTLTGCRNSCWVKGLQLVQQCFFVMFQRPHRHRHMRIDMETHCSDSPCVAFPAGAAPRISRSRCTGVARTDLSVLCDHLQPFQPSTVVLRLVFEEEKRHRPLRTAPHPAAQRKAVPAQRYPANPRLKIGLGIPAPIR